MSSTSAVSGLRLSPYQSATEIFDHLQSLDLSGDGSLQLAEAAHRPAFHLMTASIDAHLVGYAATSLSGEDVRLDPVVLSPALAPHDAEKVCEALVDGLLRLDERPWARLVVRPRSPGLRLLLDRGWRLESPDPNSVGLILSGAEASA